MFNSQMIDYAIIGLYIVMVMGVGVYFSRNENNSGDYLLGGRRMPFFAIGLSCMMSLASTVSIVMVPGEIYKNGLTLFFLTSTFGALMAIPCFLMFIRFYFKMGSFTPYEYLEKRYSPTVRTIIAISGLYTRTIYLAVVLVASSRVFEGAYGWAPWFTILIVGVFGTAYTVLGGMKAVVWSDVLQFVILFGGFSVIVVMLCWKIDGGAIGAVTYAFEHGRGLPHYSTADFYKLTPYVRLCFWILLLNSIIAPLTEACSDQILIQRFLSTKDWKEAFKSQIVTTCTRIPYALILWFIGLALFAFYQQNPDPTLSSADGVFFKFVSTHLPTPIPGIFMAAMLAAIMSTLDSGCNSMATIWLKEVHGRFINKNLSDAQEVKISRYATFIIGAFAICLGLLVNLSGEWLSQSIAEIGTLFAFLSAVVLPAFLFAVLSKRANSRLIWLLTFFAFGDGIAMKIWYALSRSTVQAWKPGEPLGWAGPLSISYLLVPFAVAVLLIPVWKVLKNMQYPKCAFTAALASALFWGVTEAIAIWYVYSNLFIREQPQERSFAFGLPMVLIVGFIALRFCKVQPKEKYQGLTLSTINEKIIQQ